MVQKLPVPAIVEAAEQAVAAGDYASAERHLREAIAVQEATVGPSHPDLANTLNNLGVVCERAGKTVEAERSYRQAYAVARSALDAEHPFVVTSARNLREFCEAWGLPFERPTTPSTVPARAERPAHTPVPTPDHSPPAEPRRPSFAISVRTLAILGAGVLAFIWLIVSGPFRTGRDDRSAASPPTVVTDKPAGPAGAPAAVTPREGKAVESPHAPATSRPGNMSSRAGHGRTDGAVTSVSVARAQVCRGLSTRASNGTDWPCDPVRDSAPAGTLFFYTRVVSAQPTMVLHRWYRGVSLQQQVELSVNANPGAGYRTYSRLTIGPERAGDWTVELRTTDGTLLHKEFFVVR
jgi:hypothetical protein